MSTRTPPPADSEVLAVKTAVPPLADASDAETDTEVLRSVPQRFEIVDEKTANWLVRRILVAREYGMRVKEWAEREKRRADREEQTLLFLFGRQLERWAKAQIEKADGRRKSLCLPGGTVGFRTESAKLVVDDEEAALAWAHQNLPHAIQTVEKLSKAAINEHFEGTGELPDGAHVEAAKERFSIR